MQTVNELLNPAPSSSNFWQKKRGRPSESNVNAENTDSGLSSPSHLAYSFNPKRSKVTYNKLNSKTYDEVGIGLCRKTKVDAVGWPIKLFKIWYSPMLQYKQKLFPAISHVFVKKKKCLQTERNLQKSLNSSNSHGNIFFDSSFRRVVKRVKFKAHKCVRCYNAALIVPSLLHSLY